MNWLDWVSIGIIVILAVRCLVRGFVQEVLDVASWIVGLTVALLLYKQGGGFLATKWPGLPVPMVIAFIAEFALAFLLTRLLGHVLREGLEAANLVVFDKVGGFILGAFEGLIAVSLILLVIQALGGIFDTSKLLSTSFFARTILPVIGPEVAKAIGGQGNSAPQLKLPELPKGGLPQSGTLPAAKP